MIDTQNADFRILVYQLSRSLYGFYVVQVKFSKICPEHVRLALFRVKMSPECGHLVLNLFSLPEGLHCLFKLGLTLCHVIKEHHIDGREVKSTVVDF